MVTYLVCPQCKGDVEFSNAVVQITVELFNSPSHGTIDPTSFALYIITTTGAASIALPEAQPVVGPGPQLTYAWTVSAGELPQPAAIQQVYFTADTDEGTYKFELTVHP